MHRSPAHEKILSRKPTPFNYDLSATIRSCGLGAVTKEEEPLHKEEEDDLDFGDVVKEEEVDEEEALHAKIMSERTAKQAQPPP